MQAKSLKSTILTLLYADHSCGMLINAPVIGVLTLGLLTVANANSIGIRNVLHLTGLMKRTLISCWDGYVLCYTSPISTTDHMVIDVASSCMSCCNTRTLRDANQQFEVSAAASNLKSLSNICTAAASQDMNKCSEILRDFDFDDFRKRLDTLSQFDSHLKHVLLHENSLKGLDSEIKKLTDLLSSLSPTLQSQDHVHDSPSHR